MSMAYIELAAALCMVAMTGFINTRGFWNQMALMPFFVLCAILMIDALTRLNWI